jgi:hypothetical protein
MINLKLNKRIIKNKNFKKNKILMKNLFKKEEELVKLPFIKEEPLMFSPRKDQNSKIFNRLVRNKRESSFHYNTMLMVVVNLNIAQFCFPYMVRINGIFVVLIIVILLLINAYFIQKDILTTLINNRNSENCNFAKLTEDYLGKFCAIILEVLFMIWFFLYSLLNVKTFVQLFVYLFEFSVGIRWVVIGFSSILLFVILINSKKGNLFSQWIPYTCIAVSIITFMVRI